MFEKKFFYRATVAFLGYQYFGWQKQLEGFPSIQGTIEKAIEKFHTGEKFKILGASRTDAKVSAFAHMFKLTIDHEYDPKELHELINKNLPQDIHISLVEKSTAEFRIINDTKLKEYYYFFSNHKEPSPFSTPFFVNFEEDLNFGLMQKAAKLFEGDHNFKNYVYKGNDEKIYDRSIISSTIEKNTDYFQGHGETWVFKIKASGFMRHQVRIMMGTLINVGRGKTSLEDITASFNPEIQTKTGFIAPASGLFLKQIWF